MGEAAVLRWEEFWNSINTLEFHSTAFRELWRSFQKSWPKFVTYYASNKRNYLEMGLLLAFAVASGSLYRLISNPWLLCLQGIAQEVNYIEMHLSNY